MFYGLDVHKEFIQICRLSSDGKQRQDSRIHGQLPGSDEAPGQPGVAQDRQVDVAAPRLPHHRERPPLFAVPLEFPC